MNFFKIIILFALLPACRPARKTDYSKVKSDHEARMALIKTMPDPYEAAIPDSMKRWIPIFKDVYINDQKYRIVGYNMTKEEWEKQKLLDSADLETVRSYLDNHGWPAGMEIGFLGKRAVGIVIQHSPLAVQEKYYPSLVEAYKKDTFLFETLALMEDRINMRNHRAQFYGSQLISYQGKPTLYPVKNIDSLEIYRHTMGFRMSMTDYLKLLKVDWDAGAYQSILPDLKKDLHVSDTPGIHFVR